MTPPPGATLLKLHVQPYWDDDLGITAPTPALAARLKPPRPLPPPPAYSEDVSSAFYKEAFEVYETVKTLTPEQRATHRQHQATHFARVVKDGAIYAQPFSEGGAAASGDATRRPDPDRR